MDFAGGHQNMSFRKGTSVDTCRWRGFRICTHADLNNIHLVRLERRVCLRDDHRYSIHLHANFFDYYPTGTKLEPSEFTDTKIFAQGERGIMEFTYDFPGLFMFHAHVSEFAELGWMGLFEVEG